MKQNPVSILVNKGVVMVDRLEANTEGIVEDMELKENTVVMDMVPLFWLWASNSRRLPPIRRGDHRNPDGPPAGDPRSPAVSWRGAWGGGPSV